MKKSSENIGQRLTGHEIATYSLGALGSGFSGNCVNAFFLVYLCIYQNLNPLIMTVAFVLAKVWDAVNDPMLAALVNNTRKSRFGRYRPWILAGAAMNAVTLVCMFSPLPNASIGVRYVYYITMYVLWGMTYTVTDVPFWSMLPTIADSTAERNRASSMAKLIGGLGGFLAGMVGTSFVLPKFSGSGMNKAYTILGAISGLIMITLILFTVFGNREKYPVPHERVGFSGLLKLFKENDQLRAYAANLLLFVTGTTIALAQILYLYVYCYEDGANYLSSKSSYTLFWVIACTGQGISMFFYNQLTRKIPREKIYGISFLACIISYIMMFLVFFILKPGNYMLNAVLVALSGAALMTASGMNQIGSTVMIADVVDYGEYKTGKRSDSVVFSVQTMINKFAGAIAMLILGIGISVAGLPTITDLPLTDAATGAYKQTVQVYTDDDGKYLINNDELYEKVAAEPAYASKIKAVDGELISGKSLTILRGFMFLIPIPLTVAGYYCYKNKYWLYGEKYDSIKAEIDRRRKENEGADAATQSK